MNKCDVFVSYRRDGGWWFGDTVKKRLQRNGYSVYYSEKSLSSGDLSLDQIKECIQECNVMVVILSSHSLDNCVNPNDWFRQQIELALELKKKLIPVYLNEFSFPEELPAEIKELKLYQEVKVDPDNRVFWFEKLKRSINNALGSEAPKTQEKVTLTPYMGDDPYVFISYSHAETETALEIVERLQKEGFRVWYDEGIEPGSKWDEIIAAHVKNCGCFLALISGKYIDSENCKDELFFAKDKKKPSALIYLEDVELTDGLNMRQGRLQAIHMYKYKDHPERFYEKVYAAQGIDACKERKNEDV